MSEEVKRIIKCRKCWHVMLVPESWLPEMLLIEEWLKVWAPDLVEPLQELASVRKTSFREALVTVLRKGLVPDEAEVREGV